MDAVWNLEDKLNLSTPTAGALLACSLVLVIGVCVAIFRVGRKGRNRVVDEQKCGNESTESESCSSGDRELLVKDVLSESGRWSKATRWKEGCPGVVDRWRQRWWRTAGEWGRERRRASVWQRPILMGEKCELPRFSGLILYDENGNPLVQ